MTKMIISCGSREVSIYIPKEASGHMPVVYSCMFGDEADETAAWLYQKGGSPVAAVFSAISGGDWDNDLSPWQAPKAFKGGSDFGGGADAFIRELTETIMPAVEEPLAAWPNTETGAQPIVPEYSAIAGYSLAGLFSVYAAWTSGCFRRGVSASGSMWFDGFVDYLKKNPSAQPPERFYFSLGDKEKNTKNQRMAVVEERTREAEALMEAAGAETIFELNEGGHFSEPEHRTARGIRWMLK